MIVYVSLAIVIGFLVISAIAWQVFAARSEHRHLGDDVYVRDTSDGGLREMGPPEQGTEAVLHERFAHGEIDERTYQHQLRDLHHPPAA